jgi:hypothetical protein
MLAGTPPQVVSEILGHAGIATTKDTYGHLVVDDKCTAAEAMSGALFGGRFPWLTQWRERPLAIIAWGL